MSLKHLGKVNQKMEVKSTKNTHGLGSKPIHHLLLQVMDRTLLPGLEF